MDTEPNGSSSQNNENTDNDNNTKKNDPIVQYIALRSDLKWPKGALIAQSCHATAAVIHLNYSDKETVEYLANLDSMHKIVVGVPSEQELNDLNILLTKNDVKFKLWIEQPENIPTCLATKPYSKSLVEKFFKAFKLLR
jgi:peptidyl-tRNA hydrolase